MNFMEIPRNLMDKNPSSDCMMISQIIENGELFVISIHFLLTGCYNSEWFVFTTIKLGKHMPWFIGTILQKLRVYIPIYVCPYATT